MRASPSARWRKSAAFTTSSPSRTTRNRCCAGCRCLSRGDLAQQALDEARIGGLDEVQLAARLERLAPIVLARVGAHRDDAHGVAAFLLDLARHFEAVDSPLA